MKQEPNTKKKYRKYDASFKVDAVRQMEQGRSVAELSVSLGVGQSLLHRWKKETPLLNRPAKVDHLTWGAMNR